MTWPKTKTPLVPGTRDFKRRRAAVIRRRYGVLLRRKARDELGVDEVDTAGDADILFGDM